jgi:hypothetical protein
MDIFASGRVVAVDMSPLAKSGECITFAGLLQAYVISLLLTMQASRRTFRCLDGLYCEAGMKLLDAPSVSQSSISLSSLSRPVASAGTSGSIPSIVPEIQLQLISSWVLQAVVALTEKRSRSCENHCRWLLIFIVKASGSHLGLGKRVTLRFRVTPTSSLPDE